MNRRKIQTEELMRETEKLLLEQGYGGFNFSTLSKALNVGRTTLYEYYDTKDDLIVAYMNRLMNSYKQDLKKIVYQENTEAQLLELIELMINYSHIHNIIKMIPLLQNTSSTVEKLKKDFVKDHVYIIEEIETIINNGKKDGIIRKEIPTDVLVNILFNTINKPTSIKIDRTSWAKWVWEILSSGVSSQR